MPHRRGTFGHAEIQRPVAFRGSIPRVLEGFSEVLLGGLGALALLSYMEVSVDRNTATETQTLK